LIKFQVWQVDQLARYIEEQETTEARGSVVFHVRAGTGTESILQYQNAVPNASHSTTKNKSLSPYNLFRSNNILVGTTVKQLRGT